MTSVSLHLPVRALICEDMVYRDTDSSEAREISCAWAYVPVVLLSASCAVQTRHHPLA